MLSCGGSRGELQEAGLQEGFLEEETAEGGGMREGVPGPGLARVRVQGRGQAGGLCREQK